MVEARAPETILKRGSTGETTAKLQTLLARAGYHPGPADGDFGRRTEQALKAFQEDHHLRANGQAGTGTVNRLREAVTARQASLRPGSTGAETRSLQGLLTRAGYPPGQADGIYGAKTRDAVRAYQASQGLPTTGTADPATVDGLREFIDGTIGRGARGEPTRELQGLLNRAGYDAGAVDGDFGARTERALRRFQRDRGLAVNGRAGDGTIGELRKIANELGETRRTTGWKHGYSFPLTLAPIGHGFELNVTAARDFRRMEAAARADGVTLQINSAFRSYEHQRRLYDTMAPGMAARPGYSNHQGGRSVDIDVVSDRTLNWLRRNAGRFNFTNDVPHEPWHWTHDAVIV